jgi:hypothetical protein
VQYSNYNFPPVFVNWWSLISGRANLYSPSLNWRKLPTSSKFGIIQFFAELDDTLAIFTRKFWNQLSYGSVTWGLLPFVNDIKAVLETVSNMSVDLNSFSYEDELLRMFDFEHSLGAYEFSIDGRSVTRCVGLGDLSLQTEAQRWLDRLGFHPDIGTAWDLVPLSFVVDWLLPVGSFLESIRARGWTRSMLFRGWKTYHVDASVTINMTAPYSGTALFDLEAFGRNYVEVVLEVENIDFEFEANEPSTLQLFNIVYIFLLNKRK